MGVGETYPIADLVLVPFSSNSCALFILPSPKSPRARLGPVSQFLPTMSRLRLEPASFLSPSDALKRYDYLNLIISSSNRP